MIKSIGIVGLGRVGMVAAEKFIKTGYQVFGYTRRTEVRAEFEKLGGGKDAETLDQAKDAVAA